MKPQELLRHHVTGAIERGEAEAIVCKPVIRVTLTACTKRETFPDDSTIDTDLVTGNRTVCGVWAHEAYLERLKAERSTYSGIMHLTKVNDFVNVNA